MTMLVTGGAGYIGLHVVRALRAGGHDVVVLDDLSSGRADLVEAAGVPLVRGSVHDGELLRDTVREHDVRGVIHLAAKKQVGESVEPPLLFGDDYPTPDGSCVRDFIHVADLAGAHVAALDHLTGGGSSVLLNVGRGEGYSVLDVLDMVGSVTGLPAKPEVRPRRAGDP